MKKKIIYSIISAGFLVLVYAVSMIERVDIRRLEYLAPPGEPASIEFELIGQSAYNPEGLYEENAWKVGSPITLWEVSDTDSDLKKFSERDQFTALVDFDFDNHCLILSYGRQIVEMESQLYPYFGKSTYVLIVTFAEEHVGNEVFFYQVERKNYVQSFVRSPCYVMSENERVFAYDYVEGFNEYDREKLGW